MAHNLTVTATAPGNVPVPDPGDPRTAASVIQFAQPLANSIAYIQRQAPGAANGTAGIPLSSGQDDSGAAAVVCFTYQFGAWIETNKANGNKLVIDFLPPDRVTVNSVVVYVTGNVLGGAAHGALPATKPKVTFREVQPNPASAPTITFTASVTDAPASVAAYEAYHVLGGAGLTVNRVIDAANLLYRLEIEGEQGANSINSYFAVAGIRYSFTAP